MLAAGADPAAVEVALERALTIEPYLLSSPQDVAASLRASTADVRSTMALLAAISLFAAAFVILNTIAMTVIERVRELGLLRAAGATRAQVDRVVVTQGRCSARSGRRSVPRRASCSRRLPPRWLRTAGGVTLDGPEITPQILVAASGPAS